MGIGKSTLNGVGAASFFTAGWISSICHFPSQRVYQKARTDDEEPELERWAAGEDSNRKRRTPCRGPNSKRLASSVKH